MIINAIDILNEAKRNKHAIPHFNINNLEWAKYILEASNELNKPVILGVSEGAIKYMGGYNVVSGIVKNLIDDLNISIPVVLHLDHGSSVESCIKAIEAGFTSVMIDASKYDLNTNIEMTNRVISVARNHNVSVEAEVGCINDNGISNNSLYTKLDDALKFYEATKIDFLAPSVGSVHGLYKGEPNIDINLIKQISDKLNIPLVLHGGTGISDDTLIKSIKNGICKININTELQVAWSNEVRKYLLENNNVYDPRKIIKSGEIAIKQAVKNKINLLSNIN